jgi:hypothetical protein
MTVARNHLYPTVTRVKLVYHCILKRIRNYNDNCSSLLLNNFAKCMNKFSRYLMIASIAQNYWLLVSVRHWIF